MKEAKFRWYNHKYWWLYGNLIDYWRWLNNYDNEFWSRFAIYDRESWEFFPVDKKSIWQYTWLKDKNWTPIYEWDIVKYSNEFWTYIEEVKYNNWYYYPLIIIEDNHKITSNEVEVIWNIYDNPEFYGLNMIIQI